MSLRDPQAETQSLDNCSIIDPTKSPGPELHFPINASSQNNSPFSKKVLGLQVNWLDDRSIVNKIYPEDDFVLAYSTEKNKEATLGNLFLSNKSLDNSFITYGEQIDRPLYAPGEVNGESPTPLDDDDDFDDEDDDDNDPDCKDPFKKKFNKGLKLLSVIVKDIVVEKQSTTYKEVADIIMQDTIKFENLNINSRMERAKEEQNIKRRVYDALNVLISAGILIKEGKRVRKNDSNKKIKINMKRMEINTLKSKIVS